jgi:hypothetical protein
MFVRFVDLTFRRKHFTFTQAGLRQTFQCPSGEKVSVQAQLPAELRTNPKTSAYEVDHYEIE